MDKRIIVNEDGEKLVGVMHPNPRSKTLAIFCTGFLLDKDAIFLPDLANTLSNYISVFRFDFSGYGESQGNLEKNSLWKEVRDLKKIMQVIGKEYDSIGLIGHSKGATIEILASENKRVDFLICIAGVAYPYQKFLAALSEVQKKELLHGSKISLKPFFNVKAFLTQEMVTGLEKMNVPESAKKINCPVLVVHAKDDELVPYQEAVELTAAFPNANLKTLEQGGHFLNRKAVKQQLISAVVDWLRTKNMLV